MAKPLILFFARGYQADFFPVLQSDRFEGVFVTLTKAERAIAEARGVRVEACFEEDYESLPVVAVGDDYLRTSLMADRFLGRFDDARRAEILGKEISFWRRLFERFAFAAVVNELVAIEIAEVLLIEARARDIPYLACMHSVVDDRFYWLPDPISISGARLTLGDAGDEARAIAAAYTQALEAKTHRPFYVRKLSGRYAPRPFLAALVKWSIERWRMHRGPFRYENYEEDYRKRIDVYLRGFLLKYDRVPDLPRDKEVIFYPLHQEPEATLNYMSEFYANQVSTIENILKCLSPNQVLVVKEHPIDKGSLLRAKFWNLRKAASGLYFLPGEVDGHEVFAVAQRIVTLTSTVGWEAAAIGKKVYVLGQIFYDILPGIERVPDFPTLKRLLRAPADDHRVTFPQIESFVARLVEICHPGNPLPHDTLYSQQNIDRTIDAIAATVDA